MSETEFQTQSQTTQSHNVMVFYVIHTDDFYSTHKKPLIISYFGKLYNIFIKKRIGRPDMFYIIGEKIYVKLWNDIKKDILAYISSMHNDNIFFNRSAEVIKADKNIKYDHDTKILSCDNKNIILGGFNLVSTLEELEPELIPPVLAVICYKLT